MYEDRYNLARKKVKKKKGFYTHLGVYIAVGIFFLAMNIATFHESQEWWFFFPLLPWSIGLFIHYFSIFGLPGTDILTKEWEDRELEKEMQRLGADPAEYRAPLEEDDAGDALDLNNKPPVPRRSRADGKDWEDGDYV